MTDRPALPTLTKVPMKILLFLLPLLSLVSKEICYFYPPEGWQAALPKNLSEHVQIGFVGEGTGGFHPSINLATEETDASLKEYVKAVKEIHLSQPNTTVRSLGKFCMKGGEGLLLEISAPSFWGPLTLLQAILVRDDIAYILTGAILKTQFLKLQQEVLGALKTLSFAQDFAAPILDPAQKEAFQALFSSLGSQPKKEEWKALQSMAESLGKEMGAHWQFLVLKEGHAKIYLEEIPKISNMEEKVNLEDTP